MEKLLLNFVGIYSTVLCSSATIDVDLYFFQTLDFIKSKQDFLGSVLKHLGTSAIMDLLLRLVTCVESEELRAQILAVSFLVVLRLVKAIYHHLSKLAAFIS